LPPITIPTLPPITIPTLPPITIPTLPPVSTGLLAHIPPEIAATCRDQIVDYPGSIEGFSCRPPSVAAVAYYISFVDAASMDAVFDDRWATDGPEAVDGGLCEDADQGVGSLYYDDGTTGRYLCFQPDGINGYYLYWTSPATNILSWAGVDGDTISPLLDWWESAGPIPDPTGSVPPVDPGFPTLPPIDPGVPTLPPVDPGQPPVGGGRTCAGYPPAPPLTPNDLLGAWNWMNVTYWEDGTDYYTGVYGTWTFSVDGRWSGERTISSGIPGGFDAVTTGPGNWSFDGYALTVTFDDGTQTEVYDTVRITSAAADAPVLSLEQVGDGVDCTVWLLGR
jgi:hypothetical protein